MKKVILITLPIIILLAVGTFLYLSADNDLLLKEDELKKPDFLKDKQAVIYFSTRADQDTDGSGFSYAVFVDEEGQAKAVKMKGLELGTVAKSEDRVFLEAKDKVRIIGNGYKEFPMKKEQYTGERSGYLEKEDMFFSIYNTGFSENGYDSDVRYGNEKGFRTGTIPHYIVASGLIDGRIYILTEDDEEGKILGLKEVSFKNKLTVKHLTTIKFKRELSPTTIQSDDKYFYLIMDDDKDEHNGKVLLLRIDKKTYDQDRFTLAKYTDVANINRTIVFNTRRSAYIWDDELYYVDGLGDVYTFHTETEKINKKFSFQGYKSDGVRYGEEIAFNDEHLYFYRYNPKTEKHTIDQYQLKTGSLKSRQEIKGLEEILSKKEITAIFHRRPHSYDFMILQD